jgi:hypothetical protein
MKGIRELKPSPQKSGTPLGIWTLAQVALEISKLPGGAQEFEQNMDLAFDILQKYERKLKSMPERLVDGDEQNAS